jgi:hypothetical protein
MIMRLLALGLLGFAAPTMSLRGKQICTSICEAVRAGLWGIYLSAI